MSNWRIWCYTLGILGGLQFLLLTSWAMAIYPGGTIHHPEFEGYNFIYNYFSDLGRTYTFDRTPNWESHRLFKTSLTIAGLSVILFFVALPGLFRPQGARLVAYLAAFFGIGAGICYIGIGWVPYNVSYYGHISFVRTGFLLFLAMSLCYATAIVSAPQYPNRYARGFAVFIIILAIQIYIMLFGPRSWRSNDGLLLQAVAQKIVVYAEILCMIYQSWGALRLARARSSS